MKPNAVAHEADNIMPSVGKLFSLPDKAVNVIFTKTGICKHAKDHVHQMNCKGIEEFKGQKKFDNKNIEVTQCKFNGKRAWHIRFGCTPLSPESIWSQCRRDLLSGPPRILGGCRKAVKFIIKVMSNYFKANDIFEILFEDDEVIDCRLANEGFSSGSESSSSDESAQAEAEDVKPMKMSELSQPIALGTIPRSSDMPFCAKFCVPIDNTNTVDGLLNELISLKNQAKEIFLRRIKIAPKRS